MSGGKKVLYRIKIFFLLKYLHYKPFQIFFPKILYFNKINSGRTLSLTKKEHGLRTECCQVPEVGSKQLVKYTEFGQPRLQGLNGSLKIQ